MKYQDWIDQQVAESKCIMVVASHEDPFVRAGSVAGELKVMSQSTFAAGWPKHADPSIKIWISREVDRETLPDLSHNEVTYEDVETAV